MDSAGQDYVGELRGAVLATIRNAQPDTWWANRLWVLQETVVARQVNVMFGEYKVPWAMFLDTARGSQAALLATDRLTTPAIQGLVAIDTVRSSTKINSDGATGLALRELLLRTSRSVTTLPFDRIYALVSFDVEERACYCDRLS